MRVSTWIDRLTDESNPWFQAVTLEDSGSYVDAVSYYVSDATECLNRGLTARAALSCSCAARCLEKEGRGYSTYAQKLYGQAAFIYRANANAAIGRSIRECLWSLKQAHTCYLLANDDERANEVLNALNSLERRVNPFVMEVVPEQGIDMKHSYLRVLGSAGVVDDQTIAQQIENFIERVNIKLKEGKTQPVASDEIGDEEDNEKSIINQLG